MSNNYFTTGTITSSGPMGSTGPTSSHSTVTYSTGTVGTTYLNVGATGATGATYSSITSSYVDSNDIIIRRHGKPDIKVGECLDLIMDRLSILTPDIQKLKKYAALKKAYENYKLIESLIQEEHKDGN